MGKNIIKPLLNDITIEITNRCQLRCGHCGIWTEKTLHEMTASFVARLMQAFLERYTLNFVSITGGEPFLNKNCGRILELLSVLYRQGKITGFGVYTNAAFFESIRKVFSTCEQDLSGLHVGISLDGSPHIHDRIRGKGAFQKTLKTMEWLSKNFGHQIILELKFTVNRVNFKEIGYVYELAKRLNARFSPKIMESGVSAYYHRQDMPQAKSLAMLTPMMIQEVNEQITKILKEGSKGVDVPMLKALLVLLSKSKSCIHQCLTPEKSLFINAYREVYPCLYWPSAGKVSLSGQLPKKLDLKREAYAEKARKGHCPGCLAYHGFLKDFNLSYLPIT
ncbi:MAG: radical SAM protein [Candidatus Omnitrophica bacterium]|nr:radical SAM protein [Candidatus Omnitrophota bacterium]